MTDSGDLEDGDVLRVKRRSEGESIFEVHLYIDEFGDLEFDPAFTPEPYDEWHREYREWRGCIHKERLI